MSDDPGASLILRPWPLLLTTEMASQFLSLDRERFLELVKQIRIDAIDIDGDEVRWHRRDIEKAVSKLPKIYSQSLMKSSLRARSLDDSTIDRIAAAVAVRMQGVGQARLPELVSLRDACKALGVGRSTIYRLINTGRIEVKHIGRRSLIPRSEIEKIQLDGS